WTYPVGTVFARTLAVPAAAATPTDSEPTVCNIETQILHYDGGDWRPYSYVWNEDQTDAVLAPAEGTQTRVMIDGREWTWPIHSRSECSTCHTSPAGFTLGFLPQNLRVPASSGAVDQLAELVEDGILTAEVAALDGRPAVCDPYDAHNDLEWRVRSYLMVNCAHCHRREAGGNAAIEFPIEKSLEATRAVGTPPTQGTFDIPHARIVAPGDPSRSVLFYRLATVGPGHMPHLGLRHIDEQGLRLFSEWIVGLPSGNDGDAALREALQQRRREETAAVNSLLSLASSRQDLPADPALVQRVLATTSGAVELAAALGDAPLSEAGRGDLIAAGARHENILIRGLFERFLPQNERSRRLGTSVDPAAILALQGNAERGRALFSSAGVQCRSCHQIGKTGQPVGPPLNDVGGRLTAPQ